MIIIITHGNDPPPETLLDNEDDPSKNTVGDVIPNPPNQESPGPDVQHPVLSRELPGCPPSRRDTTIPDYFRMVESTGPVEEPALTAQLEGEEESYELRHDDNFVEKDYAILERKKKERMMVLNGSNTDVGQAEEPTNINDVPDTVNITATPAPSVEDIGNQRPENNMKKTFRTVEHNVGGATNLSDGGDVGAVPDDDDQPCNNEAVRVHDDAVHTNEISMGVGCSTTNDMKMMNVCEVRCNIIEERCTTHDCITKKIKVTSKQWKWKAKQKTFGYVSSRQTKFICSARIQGSTAPDISTQVEPASTPAQRGAMGDEVGRLLEVNNDTRGADQIRESSDNQPEQVPGRYDVMYT